MNNIINLTKMSFLNLKAVSKQIWMVWAIWIFVAMYNPLFLNMLFGLTVFITLYQVMAYEDANGIDNLIASLPVKKNEYVMSRYLMGVFSLLIGVILALIIYYVSPNVDTNKLPIELLFTVGLTSGITALSIIVPMVLKFGVNKGRMVITIISMIVIMSPSFILENLRESGVINDVLELVNRLGLPVLSIIFNVAVLIISILVCIKLYNKKELV